MRLHMARLMTLLLVGVLLLAGCGHTSTEKLPESSESSQSQSADDDVQDEEPDEEPDEPAEAEPSVAQEDLAGYTALGKLRFKVPDGYQGTMLSGDGELLAYLIEDEAMQIRLFSGVMEEPMDAETFANGLVDATKELYSPEAVEYELDGGFFEVGGRDWYQITHSLLTEEEKFLMVIHYVHVDGLEYYLITLQAAFFYPPLVMDDIDVLLESLRVVEDGAGAVASGVNTYMVKDLRIDLPQDMEILQEDDGSSYLLVGIHGDNWFVTVRCVTEGTDYTSMEFAQTVITGMVEEDEVVLLDGPWELTVNGIDFIGCDYMLSGGEHGTTFFYVVQGDCYSVHMMAVDLVSFESNKPAMGEILYTISLA